MAILNFLGILFFKGTQYTQITTRNVHLLIDVRHGILIQYDKNYIEVMGVRHFKKLLTLFFGCPEERFFEGLGVPMMPRCLAS